jgi:hypothetical protein
MNGFGQRLEHAAGKRIALWVKKLNGGNKIFVPAADVGIAHLVLHSNRFLRCSRLQKYSRASQQTYFRCVKVVVR